MRKSLDIMMILPLIAIIGVVATTTAYAEAPSTKKSVDYMAVMASVHAAELGSKIPNFISQSQFTVREQGVNWLVPVNHIDRKLRVQFGVAMAGVAYDFNSGDTVTLSSSSDRAPSRTQLKPYTYIGINFGL